MNERSEGNDVYIRNKIKIFIFYRNIKLTAERYDIIIM